MTTTIDALVEALQDALDFDTEYPWADRAKSAIAQARAEPQDPDLTIAYMAGFEKGRDAEQSGQAEPVAWMTNDDEGSPAMLFFDKQEAENFCDEGEDPTPLFDTQPAAPVAKLEPLTRDEIEAVRLETGYAAGLERFTVITRAIEAAHNAKLGGA